MKKRINVIDLFAGVGGLSYGFAKNPSFEILIANEIANDIAKAYSINHPEVKMLCSDIADIDQNILDTTLGNQTIDLIIGGPPCQSYSTLGKRNMDYRANLFTQYCRILALLKPKAFVFENVSGLLSMDKGRLIVLIHDEFKKLGYELKTELLNALDYGVPQIRERVIVVGVLGENNFEYPKPTHGESNLLQMLKPYVTLKDALGDLPSLKSCETGNSYNYEPNNEFLRFVRDTDVLTEHNAPYNGEHLIEIMQTLKEGQGKDDLPEDIRPKSGYGNTYAKLWWDRPSTTITRNFACPSSSRCIHPRDSRAMSIREGARLQSFPDSYKFYGSDGSKRLEIGNAVPPLLSIALAKEVSKIF